MCRNIKNRPSGILFVVDIQIQNKPEVSQAEGRKPKEIKTLIPRTPNEAGDLRCPGTYLKSKFLFIPKSTSK